MLMEWTDTKRQSADIFTKCFTAALEWKHVRALICTSNKLDECFQAICGDKPPAGMTPSHVGKDSEATKTELKAQSVHDALMGTAACSSGQPEADAAVELKGQYMSVLGALAYLMVTRIDLAVYVAALQRAAHAPTVAHAKRLNVLVRYVQRTPVDLAYRKLHGPVELLVISDSSFKRETDTGHAMKGYLIVLHSSTTSGSTGQPVAAGNSSSSQSPLWTTESSQSTTLA